MSKRRLARACLIAALAAAVTPAVRAAGGVPDAVTPGDRMAMADRLFDRGEYARARREYESLRTAEGIAADELLYRLAECDRSLGETAKAREEYAKLLESHPLSRRAPRARLMKALSSQGDERRHELRLLDSENVATNIRAIALYHLGTMTKDAALLERCVQLDPKGRYAPYAKFQRASIAGASSDPEVRQQAIRDLNDIIYTSDPVLAREAHYIAALRCYSEKRYDLASSLFRRYMKRYPQDERMGPARTMAAWSDYMRGAYGDAATLCEGAGGEDAAYLRAMCAYSSGDHAAARAALGAYVEEFPEGRYRKAAELTKARLDFAAAGKGEDSAKIVEAARRGVALSGTPGDRLRLAWALEKASLDDEAMAEYEKLARDFPDSEEAATALFRRALVDIRASRWAAAELALAELLESRKPSKGHRAEAWYWRGMAAFMLDHEEEGAKYLEKALEGELAIDQRREARLVLADWDWKEDRTEKAAAEYAALVADGAAKRMGVSKIRQTGLMLLAAGDKPEFIDAAATCARAIVERADSAQWRQAGYILLAQAEERAGRYTAALAAYREAFDGDKTRTSDAPEAMLALGILESRHGDNARAEAALREAVALNANDGARRAQAYLWLAKNALARGDKEGAAGYATVVATLFEDGGAVGEANRILEALRAP